LRGPALSLGRALEIPVASDHHLGDLPLVEYPRKVLLADDQGSLDQAVLVPELLDPLFQVRDRLLLEGSRPASEVERRRFCTITAM